MRLSSLIAPADGAVFFGDDKQIVGISADSRQIEQGYVFIAVPGFKLDGTSFIKEAIENGAVAVIAEEGIEAASLPSHVTLITVPDVRAALSIAASRYYPRQPQTIATVTGTSGKTSTVHFTRQLWQMAGHKSVSIGTLGLVTKEGASYGSLTTPDPITLHKLIDSQASHNVTHLAMEASSHGIELHRLDHVRTSYAAFTNLSRDHLDYHKTMESYFAAKLRLFTSILRSDGVAIINADIPEYDSLLGVCTSRNLKYLTYGKQGKDVRLLSSSPIAGGQTMQFEALGTKYDIVLPIVGSFQIDNSLCALTIALASGEPVDATVENMTKLTGVPGRLEYIGTSERGGTVYVDYAHKPSALENVLSALRDHVRATNGKLHVVFGCGGDRDKGKRPLMGKIAQNMADYVIVTDDNPRSEVPAAIRKEILGGCATDSSLKEIGDRATAIQQGIEALSDNDVLVIAGKGHEEGQIVGDKVLPFNDAQEARKVLGIG
ncbi:MAG: UDP-N-acetylmuramoyl-L-alanyl-D-glutamate--2,6-diaminopimelate ligase [Alphaproteobacteria bacterium]|jgi:UDP-N-acetylmuramoyl-L-alanyl-D-glutamate--2,6-diaminopimelate ligase|nr:UDP-N-acetylmuramoyl-L-alanyl-D-glutamate--2,6-diaminopimelate ligase [Alphaproteobacteria bacterium]